VYVDGEWRDKAGKVRGEVCTRDPVKLSPSSHLNAESSERTIKHGERDCISLTSAAGPLLLPSPSTLLHPGCSTRTHDAALARAAARIQTHQHSALGSVYMHPHTGYVVVSESDRQTAGVTV